MEGLLTRTADRTILTVKDVVAKEAFPDSSIT
jgi:hypothetical protein